MSKSKPYFGALGAVALAAALCAAPQAKAEEAQAAFAYQNGWAYTPLRVMETQGLVEKHAKAEGIELRASFKNLGSPGVVRDAMLAGQVQFGAVGVPTLVGLADKTAGEWKAVGSIVSLPMVLNTTGDAKSICDIKGKIALPTVKSSVQATTLQMAAKKQCGDAFALDAKTVSMTHPDGYASLLNGQVEAHFTAPPFVQLEIANGKGKVRPLANSYDILGGKSSFILLVGNDKWRAANPKAYKAINDAFEEAVAWTKAHPKEAAELFVREEKSKETPDEVFKQMTEKTVEFDTTPRRIGAYAQFMKETGTVKRDLDWKAMSMPNLQSRDGS